MNEFIVWHKNIKEFVKAHKFLIVTDDSIVNDDCEIFNYIGKTDDTTEKNKIYADCSIVEFEDGSIGYFTEDNRLLRKMYKIIKKGTILRNDTEASLVALLEMKVIGTLQQDKHLLELKWLQL